MPRNNISGPFSFMPLLLVYLITFDNSLKEKCVKKVTSKNIRKKVSKKVGILSANVEIIVSPGAVLQKNQFIGWWGKISLFVRAIPYLKYVSRETPPYFFKALHVSTGIYTISVRSCIMF